MRRGSTLLGTAHAERGHRPDRLRVRPCNQESHRITVYYRGDAAHLKSSTAVNVVVRKAPSTTSAVANPTTVKVRTGKANVTVTVSSTVATAQGRVQALVNGRVVASRGLSSGQVTLSVGRFSSLGVQSVVIRYLGNTLLAASQSTVTAHRGAMTHRLAPDVASLPSVAHDLLERRGATVAAAESLTGGRLSALLSEAPGASSTFVGGVVSYATAMKIEVLGVSEDIVQTHGVVSAECAIAMARGVRALTGATYGVSTTGVAGPAEQEGKPAGTVFVGMAGPDGVSAVSLELVGDRAKITQRTCEEALATLVDALRKEETSLG